MPPARNGRRVRRRLVDAVIDRLQQQISLGVLAAGDRLPTETELTEALGVSRTTVREAVAVLSHAGLLQVRQGDGTYVASVPPGREPLDKRLQRAAALDVYEVRRSLEVEAARLAALRRSDADLRRMRNALAERDRCRAAGDADAAITADLEFHVAIAVATRNAVLVDLYQTFSGALRETLVHVAADQAIQVDTTELHHALLDCIVRKDPEGAARATASLIEVDADRLRAALDE